MALTVRFSARQSAPGAHVFVNLRVVVDSADSDNYARVGIGVTTTATPPANFGAFAHADSGEWNNASPASPFPDPLTQFTGSRTSITAGTDTPQMFSDVVQYLPLNKPLDSNYSAGRYLWAYVLTDDPPTSESTFAALSPPYHIR